MVIVATKILKAWYNYKAFNEKTFYRLKIWKNQIKNIKNFRKRKGGKKCEIDYYKPKSLGKDFFLNITKPEKR